MDVPEYISTFFLDDLVFDLFLSFIRPHIHSQPLTRMYLSHTGELNAHAVQEVLWGNAQLKVGPDALEAYDGCL